MSKKTENFNYLIYILIGGVMGLIFKKASGMPENTTGYIHGFNFNLFVYVGAIALSFVIFIVFSLIADKIASRLDPSKRIGLIDAALYAIYGMTAAAVFYLIYGIYVNENNLWPGTASTTYLRQMVNHRAYFALIFIIAAILFFTLSRDMSKQNRPFRIGIGFLFALLNAIALWCPDFFRDGGGGVPHVHAVLNSMVNAAHFRPFDQLNCSIYGHYSLICIPFIKLFGNDLTAILITLCFLGFVAFLAIFYVAGKLIRRDSIYVAALFAITGTTTILTRRGQYYQINPLRLIFPFLMLAVITYGAVHRGEGKDKRITALKYIVGVLAVIWNFETGLFSVAVCAASDIFVSLYENKIFSRDTLLAVLKAIFYGAVCIIGAYAIVNAYNLMTGGSINSPRLFVYPLFSGTYNVNNLRVPLPSVKFLYFFETVLFFLTAVGMLRRQFERESDMLTDTIRFAVALSGMSSLIYFMNRAAYSNMSISHAQLVLLVASYGECALLLDKDSWKGLLSRPASFLRSGVAVVLFGGLIWLAIEGAIHIEVCYHNRANNAWQTEDMDRTLAEIKEKIPENTFGFGFCVPELWYELGWDNIGFMTDWSDINNYNIKYIKEELRNHDSFVTTVDTIKYKGYKCVETIEKNPYEICLYVKE